MKNNLSKFRKIKFLLFDCEGVIIDKSISNQNDLIIDLTKDVTKYVDAFHKHGYKAGIVTARPKDEVTDHLKRMNFDVLITSSIDKVTPIKKMLDENQLKFEELLYIGDDILDIPLLQQAGFAVCPADAKREVKRISDMICRSHSGEKVLSELLNIIEESKIELV